jgi:hypothetical protein
MQVFHYNYNVIQSPDDGEGFYAEAILEQSLMISH